MIYASHRRVTLHALIYANCRIQAALSQIVFCHNMCANRPPNKVDFSFVYELHMHYNYELN